MLAVEILSARKPQERILEVNAWESATVGGVTLSGRSGSVLRLANRVIGLSPDRYPAIYW